MTPIAVRYGRQQQRPWSASSRHSRLLAPNQERSPTRNRQIPPWRALPKPPPRWQASSGKWLPANATASRRSVRRLTFRSPHDHPKNNRGSQQGTPQSICRWTQSKWVWMPKTPCLIADEQPHKRFIAGRKSKKRQSERHPVMDRWALRHWCFPTASSAKDISNLGCAPGFA